MLTVRRFASVPLFVVGGALLLVGYGGGIAAAIYYEIQSWKLILDGNVVEGVIVGSVVLMLAVTLVNLLNIPGMAFVEGASRLWGSRDRGLADPSYLRDDYGDAYDEDSDDDLYGELGHVRDKPHACPQCGKRMVTLAGLDQHVAAKHSGHLSDQQS
jgi:hypothetical protein